MHWILVSNKLGCFQIFTWKVFSFWQGWLTHGYVRWLGGVALILFTLKTFQVCFYLVFECIKWTLIFTFGLSHLTIWFFSFFQKYLYITNIVIQPIRRRLFHINTNILQLLSLEIIELNKINKKNQYLQVLFQ
jgi:hypothetical protein